MNIIKIGIRAILITLVVFGIYGFLYMPFIIDYFWTPKSINVLAWPNIIDPECFDTFKKETGIKVNLVYFENYEELIVKFQAGGNNYDLIIGSDYAAYILLKEGLLKKLDRRKLLFWDKLYKPLLGLYYDPKNQYTIPFGWEIFGIGIDTNYYKGILPEASWKLLFDTSIAPAQIGMIDDAREIVSIAAFYLFGDKHRLTPDDLILIKNLLIDQKKQVVMYTDLRTDYILTSKMAPITLGTSSDIFSGMKLFPHLDFLIPKEGSFIVINVMCLPTKTEKDTLVYAFINYLYQPKIMKKYLDKYNFFPVRDGLISKNSRFGLIPTRSLIAQLHFFNYIIPEQKLRDLWISLKS